MYNPCNCCEKKLSSTSVTQDGTSVNIAVSFDGPLKRETKYCLILAQPVPVAGYNLPVNIVVSFTDSGAPITVPLKRYDFCCNLEFGEDLPKCRNRIPIYYTNGNDFIDMRRCEHKCFCR